MKKRNVFLISLLLIIIWIGLKVNALTPKNKIINYTVRKNDTVWSIANKYSDGNIENKINEIQYENDIKEVIHEGQILKIPVEID